MKNVKPMKEPMKKIVVIGGGFAGSACAKRLEKDFDVTLFDTKEYFEFSPSILRLVIDPGFARTIRIPHAQYLSHTNVITEKVSGIRSSYVLAASGKYPYDYLIIASGARYGLPIKGDTLVSASHSEELRQSAENVKKARSILIIGAGLVGIELAGEIVEAYPGKRVVVLEALDRIMGRSPEKVQAYAKAYLEKQGVHFILNEKLVKAEGITYCTDKGTRLAPDIAFLSVGITPHYEHLEEHCAAHLDLRKFLCVNEHLQVGDFHNIFAAGDVTAITEEKTAHNAERHAKIVVRNIQHLEKREKLERYRPKRAPLIISLGRNYGILTSKHWVIKGRIPGLLKRVVEWGELRKYRQR